MATTKASPFAPYIYVVQMDIPEEYEVEFNRVYDSEHVPELVKVPGVRSGHRYKVDTSTRSDTPRYMAIYELDSAEVVTGEAWLTAGERGAWAPKIRPVTTNRGLHVMRRIL